MSISLAMIYLILKVPTIFIELESGSWWHATLHGHSDDAFGALLTIVAGTYLVERHSKKR